MGIDDAAPACRDEDLLARYATTRAPDALEELLERHYAGAARLAEHALGDPAEAADAAQQAFIALVRAADRFDRSRAFRPWFATLLANAVRKAARGRERLRRREGWVAAQRPHADGPEAERRLQREEVEAHVLALPDAFREPVMLHFYEGLSHREIARALRIPEGTASSRIRRGLEALRASLGRAGYGSAAVPALEGLLSELGRAGSAGGGGEGGGVAGAGGAGGASTDATPTLPPKPSRPDAAAIEASAAARSSLSAVAWVGVALAPLALAGVVWLAWFGGARAESPIRVRAAGRDPAAERAGKVAAAAAPAFEGAGEASGLAADGRRSPTAEAAASAALGDADGPARLALVDASAPVAASPAAALPPGQGAVVLLLADEGGLVRGERVEAGLWRLDGAAGRAEPARAGATDERGRFALGPLAPGRYRIELAAPAAAALTLEVVADRVLEREVRLARAVAIEGALALPAGVAPDAVEVRARPLGEGLDAEARPGRASAGRYRIEGLRPGHYRIEARLVAGASGGLSGSGAAAGAAVAGLAEARAGAPVSEGPTLGLAGPTVRIDGALHFAGGEPVPVTFAPSPGAAPVRLSVRVWAPSRGAFASATVGEGGRFALDAAAGEPLALFVVAEPADGSPARVWAERAIAAATQPVALGAISLGIADPRGEPAPGDAPQAGAGGASLVGRVRGPDGAFDARRGTLVAIARLGGDGVAGTIPAPAGAEVAFEVEVEVEVAADGSFRVDGLPAGRYRVTYVPYVEVDIDVPPHGEVPVLLEPVGQGSALEVELAGAPSGLRGFARVRFAGARGDAQLDTEAFVDGLASLERVQPGPLRLEVSLFGGAWPSALRRWTYTRDLVAPSGRGRARLAWPTAADGGAIEGALDPWPTLRWVWAKGYGITAAATVPPEGCFRLDHLPPGRYRVVVVEDGDDPERVASEGIDLWVEAGGTVAVSLPFRPAARAARE